MLKRLKVKFRRTMHRISDLIVDPPLDVLGAAVLGTSTGRTLLYGAFGATFIAVSMPLHATVFFAVMLFDAFIQIEVLSALRRLMRFEVARELQQIQITHQGGGSYRTV